MTQENLLLLGICGTCLVIGLQFLLTVCILVSLRISSKERATVHREMFGLVKRIEGLTSHKREQMLKHYDQILEALSKSLPPMIASQTSQVIFETESKILSRLAELEPNIRSDEESRRKLDELIKSMESLEKTIVVLAADTVRRVMTQGRRSLLDEAPQFEDLLAA